MKKMLKIMSSTALLTLFRMISGFVIAKVVAIYTGPTGLAFLGQFQSFTVSMLGLVNAPVTNGLVRYTKEYNDCGFQACSPWWRACVQWACAILLVLVSVGCFFSKELSSFIFLDESYYWLINISLLTLPIAVAGSIIKSVLNGLQQYRRFVYLGILSVITSTLIMLLLIFEFGLDGSLFAMAIQPSIAGFIMLLFSLREPWIKIKFWWGSTGSEQRKAIGGYITMAIASALMGPLSLMLVRNIISDADGWANVGLWQAVWKISEVYLSVVSMALTTYFIPVLSSVSKKIEIENEIKNTIILVLPVTIASALSIYFLRDFVIEILFTEEFHAARDLFAFQLLGDVVKVICWFFICVMIAKGASRIFVLCEIAFSITFVVFSYIFVSFLGIEGVTIAYFVNSIVCLVFYLLTFDFVISENKGAKDI